MTFPSIPDAVRITRLQAPSSRIRMVFDTDTYNEVDDQFAVAYALLAPERLNVEAIYAAPFHNSRSISPKDGMEKSYAEIQRLLNKMKLTSTIDIHKGSTRNFEPLNLEESSAVRDLIERAMHTADDEPLYVVAIAALTNIATAIALEPRIIEKIVIVWLGGHALHWHNTREFNLRQDVLAAKLIFDCGVPLVHLPCDGVVTHLTTTVHELVHYLSGRNSLCDYLIDIVKTYEANPYGWSKVIWDVATVAYLINPEWVPTVLCNTPILTDSVTWSFDSSRHLMRYASYVHRDPIIGDMFSRLSAMAS